MNKAVLAVIVLIVGGAVGAIAWTAWNQYTYQAAPSAWRGYPTMGRPMVWWAGWQGCPMTGLSAGSWQVYNISDV